MPKSAIVSAPIDQAHTFRATKLLYIRELSGKHHSEIFDITNLGRSLLNDPLSPAYHETCQTILRANPAMESTWLLARLNVWSNSRVTITDKSTGEELASWYSSIFGYGTSHLTFVAGSSHCGHGIKVEPVAIMRSAQSFVHNSASYLWEVSPERKGWLLLQKLVSSKKIVVASYENDLGKFALGGPLLVDDKEIDALVASLTLLCCLNQRDAYYMPGLDLSKK